MEFPTVFPCIQVHKSRCSPIWKINKTLDGAEFGIHSAPPNGAMEFAYTFVDSLPEPGRLALIGFAMILGAVLLRKTLFRARPHVNSTPNVDVQGDQPVL